MEVTEESSVESIPTEILQLIFLECYHDNSRFSQSTEAPFNLISTCIRWRLVALSVPLLWSTFHVVLSSNESKPSPVVLQSWIDRSRTCPLSFSATYRGRNAFDREVFPRTRKSMKNIFMPLETLSGYMARWENVYLDLSDLPHDTKLPDYPVSAEMILETLSVRTFEPHRRHSASLIPSYMRWISSLAESSPKLEKFSSYGRGSISHLSGYNSTHSVPWSRLTSLTLEHVSERLALYILQSSSSLVECTLSDVGHYVDWIQNQHLVEPQIRDDIVIHRLERLDITAQQDLDIFWTHIIVPNLRELDIYMLPSSRQWHQGEDLVQCLVRSGSVPDTDLSGPGLAASTATTNMRGPPITRLMLRNCNMRARLGPCARLLSETLREFSVIDQAMVDDAIVELLTLPEMDKTADIKGESDGDEVKPSALCPRLEQLTLVRCIAASDGLTSRMVKSRWLPEPEAHPTVNVAWGKGKDDETAVPRKLKFVRIEFSSPKHAEDFHQLEEMYAEGLKGRVEMKKEYVSFTSNNLPRRANSIHLSVKLAKQQVVRPVPAHVPVLQPPPLWGSSK